VSIKTLQGDLRGCIGTILPAHPRLDLEIVSNAVAASTRDPRFPPMKASELENVTFSVDVLGRPEPVPDRKELDPAIWGVIVSRGTRRGVLLPDLEGVDTVEQQLDIATYKAGIRRSEDFAIERFRVDRYSEKSK
jgi:AmmeMemoRadiSam system protein A